MLVGEATPAGKSVAEAQPALLGCLAAPLAQRVLMRATLDEVTKPYRASCWLFDRECYCLLVVFLSMPRVPMNKN